MVNNLEQLRGLVGHYTKFVFDNHESFLEILSTEYIWVLINISFGEGCIKVVYVLNCGQYVSDTLDYSIFEKWYETRSLQIQA